MVCGGRESVRAEDNSINPTEPVSTNTPSIVWQLEVVPGTQTVTLVNAALG
jgi:hypothetical protein